MPANAKNRNIKSILMNKVNSNSFKTGIVSLFEVLLLIGICFIIIYPFLIKISAAFMAVEDTYDDTVSMIPRHPTFENIIYIFKELPMLESLLNTLLISLMVAFLTTFTSVLVGYGIAKFRFYGKGIVIFFVLFSLLIPLSTVLIPSYMYFRYFDLFGIISLISGKDISTVNTYFPSAFLAATGFGFRGGLFILIMYQGFKGLPKELDEASMVDGASVAQTFIVVNLPLVKAMVAVVFIISFAWQWMDNNYVGQFFSNNSFFPQILTLIATDFETSLGNGSYVKSLITNSAVLVMVTPLVILYCFVQRQLVEGIERTGLVG